MKVTFVVNLEIDAGLVELDAKRYRRSTGQMLEEVVADCECRLHDSVRFRDCVAGVSVEPLDARKRIPEGPEERHG